MTQPFPSPVCKPAYGALTICRWGSWPRSAVAAVPTVGDEGKLPDSLPSLFWPDVPLNLDTLRIIAPYAVAMAVVGLLESLMTAKLVDDVTDTHSEKTREAWGRGTANFITGAW